MFILTEKDAEEISKLYKGVGDPKALEKAKEKIKWAIRNIQLSDVFLAGRLNEMIPDDPNKMVRHDIPTMQTDGKSLFYSPKFVNELTPDDVEFIVVHELLHVVLGHHKAFKDVPKTDVNLWKVVNIATDLAINDLLRTRGAPHGILYPGGGEFKDLPRGLDARNYFVRLLKKYKKPPEEQNQQKPPDNQETDNQKDDDNENDETDQNANDTPPEQGEGGESPSEDSDTPQGASDDQEGDENSEDDGGDGSDSGGNDGDSGDEGEEGGESGGSGEGDEESDGEGMGTGTGGRPDSTATQQKDIGSVGTDSSTYDKIENELNIPQDTINKMQKTGEVSPEPPTTEGTPTDTLEQHEQRMQRDVVDAEELERKREEQGINTQGYGKGNRSIIGKDYRDAFKQKSNLPWNNILANFLQQSERSERTYRVANTRFSSFAKRSPSHVLFPGYKEDKLKDLAFLVDVSGSMPRAACEKVFGEIAAVSTNKAFGKQSNIRLITFDDGIISEDIFTQNTSNKFKSVENPNMPVDKTHMHSLPLTTKTFSTFRWTSGGGGTSITPALINLKKIKPTLVVVLTDGIFSGRDIQYINNEKLIYPVVWLMTTEVTFKQGKTFNLNEYNYNI